METGTERAQWEENLNYRIHGYDGEIGADYDFTIMCNNKRFIVNVSPNSVPGGQAALLLSRLHNASIEDDDEEFQKVQMEIDDIIYEAGWRKFAQLAPTIDIESSNLPKNLHSDFYPQTFHFRLLDIQGRVEMVPKSSPQHPNTQLHLVVKDTTKWPRYSARDITVIERLMGIGYIAKVLMKGQHLCCKIAMEHTCNSVQREYECLHAIAVDRNNSHIRVPKFIGFVVDDDGNNVGILEEFIDHDVHLGKALVDSSRVSDMRKKNWAEQIRETLNFLHKIGVVWGDGKPENILIHSKTDDAWLVDFGGSYTDGWVDAKLKETMAGDEQALQKIVKLLGV